MLSSDADSLYWMSRYLERAEHTARLLDVNIVMMLDQSPTMAEKRWTRFLASLHTYLPEGADTGAYALTEKFTLDRSNPASIIACLTAARDNARQVREQISSEMWEQLNRLYLQISQTQSEEIWNGQPHDFFRMIKEGIHLFQGLADATMPRNEGWQFMDIGRFIERASKTAALLDAYAEDFHDEPQGVSRYLDWVGLLKSRTAFEAYCQIYTADIQPNRIAEFLLLDDKFPHSVRYAIRHVHTSLQALGQTTGTPRAHTVNRLAGRLHAMLDYAQIEEILAGDMHAMLLDIENQCLQIHTSIYQVYITPPIESIL